MKLFSLKYFNSLEVFIGLSRDDSTWIAMAWSMFQCQMRKVSNWLLNNLIVCWYIFLDHKAVVEFCCWSNVLFVVTHLIFLIKVVSCPCPLVSKCILALWRLTNNRRLILSVYKWDVHVSLCKTNDFKQKMWSYQRAVESFSTFWYCFFFYFLLSVRVIRSCVTMDLPL